VLHALTGAENRKLIVLQRRTARSDEKKQERNVKYRGAAGGA